MANRVVITKIIDGPRDAVFHVYLQSDGASGDETDYVLVDPETDLVPSPGGKPSLSITELSYDLSGFSAELSFDYLLNDTPVWSLSSNHCFDFRSFGGLKDRSGALDGTGKLLLTTSGFSSTEDRGTIIIKLKKN